MNQDMNNYNGQYNNQNLNNNYFQNQNNTQKQSKTKIIGVVVALVIVLIIGITLFKGNGSSSDISGSTASYGETLKINELDGLYKFNIDVTEIKNNYRIKVIGENFDSVGVKMTIENNSDKNLELSLLNFALIDSKNNKIATAGAMSYSMINEEPEMLDLLSNIAPGKSASGYVYFYEIDEDGYSVPISSDINKLEISVPSQVNSDKNAIAQEKYYIMLK